MNPKSFHTDITFYLFDPTFLASHVPPTLTLQPTKWAASFANIFFHLTILIWYTFFFHENTFLWAWIPNTKMNTKIRVNTMLDSSLRIGILNKYDFEMITCYLKAPTVGLMKFLIQFLSFHNSLFEFTLFSSLNMDLRKRKWNKVSEK